MAALAEFRKTLWSSKIIVDTEKAFVFGSPAISNRDYEGEVRAGAVLNINEIGDVTVNDYTEDTDITFQQLTGAQKQLQINQKKYFAVSVDDVLKSQADPGLMDKGSQKAAFAIKNTIDSHIAGLYAQAGIVTSNLGSAGSSLSVYATHLTATSSLLGMFSAMNRYANEADLPEEGRWFAMPPWMASYVSFAGMVDNVSKGGMKGGDPVSKGTGYIGSFMGWAMYSSNNVSVSSTQYRCMFGTPDAITFAGTIATVEGGRKEKQFGDYIKGLYVYGAKVVRPDHLGVVYAAAGGLST